MVKWSSGTLRLEVSRSAASRIGMRCREDSPSPQCIRAWPTNRTRLFAAVWQSHQLPGRRMGECFYLVLLTRQSLFGTCSKIPRYIMLQGHAGLCLPKLRCLQCCSIKAITRLSHITCKSRVLACPYVSNVMTYMSCAAISTSTVISCSSTGHHAAFMQTVACTCAVGTLYDSGRVGGSCQLAS